jgi:hypothetical protein
MAMAIGPPGSVAKREVAPSGPTLEMVLLPRFATYRYPVASNARPWGLLKGPAGKADKRPWGENFEIVKDPTFEA